MRATGIVRRIDDLGRIVIPKEIRRTLKIREGDPLEIFTDGNGIVLQKYSPLKELGEFAKEYAEALAKVAPHMVLICDKDYIVAVGDRPAKKFLGKQLSTDFAIALHQRNTLPANIMDEMPDLRFHLVEPIMSQGEVLGAVIFLGTVEMTKTEKALAQVATGFLASQLED